MQNFIQFSYIPNDEIKQALETSGVFQGKGMISAVYTLPMEDTAIQCMKKFQPI